MVDQPISPVKKEDAVLCNCFTLLTRTFSDVPLMKDIIVNKSDAMGNVVIFWYPPSKKYPEGTYHFALVTGQGLGEFFIREWNWKSCEETRRTISFLDKNLVGFVTLK